MHFLTRDFVHLLSTILGGDRSEQLAQEARVTERKGHLHRTNDRGKRAIKLHHAQAARRGPRGNARRGPGQQDPWHTAAMERLGRHLERPPSLLQKVLLPMMAVLSPILLYSKRGWMVAAVGALVWGALAASSFIDPGRLRGWSSKHWVLDGAMFGPLLFVGLAFITNMPTLVCVAIACLGCVLLLTLGPLLGPGRT